MQPYTPISFPDAAMSCLAIAHVLTGALFIAWLFRRSLRQRAQWHTVVPTPRPNHLRDRAGFTTTDFIERLAGVLVLLALALSIIVCLSDGPQ